MLFVKIVRGNLVKYFLSPLSVPLKESILRTSIFVLSNRPRL